MAQTHLVTGATDGIGRQTALELARMGAKVLVHGRSEKKAKDACGGLVKAHRAGDFNPVWGDFGSLDEVRALATRVRELAPALDVLVNNAGVFMTERKLSKDGFELTFAVNQLAPFALTHLLLGALKGAPQGRVVMVSSVAHSRGRVDLKDLQSEKAYDGYSVYASTKLSNVYFAHELARRLTGTKVTVNALHPGVIGTKLLQAGFGAGGASVESGARTSVYCATSRELTTVSGRYYSDAHEEQCAARANDPELERELYLKCCELTKTTPLDAAA